MNPSADRVRARTARDVLRRIDDPMVERLQAAVAADPAVIAARLDALEREWDTDRTLETEAAVVGLAGMALGTLVHPRWLLLPAAVATGVLLHALAGIYPWMPALRRAGLRTSREIARERYALKALRGDFSEDPT